jgi:hypothetical protein
MASSHGGSISRATLVPLPLNERTVDAAGLAARQADQEGTLRKPGADTACKFKYPTLVRAGLALLSLADCKLAPAAIL